MNLIVDVGNTFIKLAVFKNDKLLERVVSSKKDFVENLNKLLEDFNEVDSCIVSSVGNFSKKQLGQLEEKCPVFILDHHAKLPFINKYATPTTLGVDRIALISAAAQQFPKENVLVVDAGSCITYDFLNKKNEYLGGAISPGIEMRYKALETFTEKLPLLEKNLPENQIGDSTENSIHIGIAWAVVHEINGFIESYNKKVDNLTVILTGGDTHFLRDNLKNDIFANSNFLLEGLNYILKLNKASC